MHEINRTAVRVRGAVRTRGGVGKAAGSQVPPSLEQELDRLTASGDDKLRSEVAYDGRARNALIDRIVSDGYVLAPRQEDYSVAVIPAMRPEVATVDPSINTTGAGDICSGIDLVYSGWR